MNVLTNLLRNLSLNKPDSQIIVNYSEVNLEYFTQFFYMNSKKIKRLFKASIFLSFLSLFLISPKYSSSFIVLNSPDSESTSLVNTSLLSQITGGFSGTSISLSSVVNTNDFIDSIIFKENFINGNSINLIEYFDVKNSINPKHFLYKNILNEKQFNEYEKIHARKKLLDACKYSEDEYSIFSFSISLKENEVAYQIAKSIMENLNQFTIDTIQNSASEKRIYLEKRLIEVKSEILSSEKILNIFLNDNKDFLGSPKLQIEYNKLKTDVDINYQIMTQLVLEIELLKSSELKDNTQLVVLESPNISEFRSNTLLVLFLKNIILCFLCLFTTSVILSRVK